MPNLKDFARPVKKMTVPAAGLSVSIVLHSILLAFLIIGWTPEKKTLDIAKPKYIEAKLLQMKPAIAEPQVKQVEKPKPKPQPKPQPKPEVDQAAIKKAEEQKRHKIQQEKNRAEAEKKRIEQQKKAEAERRELERQKELQRQQELKRQEQARRQQELAQALAFEEELAMEEAANAQVGTYVDYMAGLIAANWSRPPSARRGMEVILEIALGSAGRVTNVKIIKSSGNSAFDLSAEQAVKKVGQFSRLTEMDPSLYQRDFRRVNLLFRPDDLRM